MTLHFLSVKKNLLFRHCGFLPDMTGAGSDIHAVKKWSPININH